MGQSRRPLHAAWDLDLDIPAPYHGPGVHGHDEERQGDVRDTGSGNRGRAGNDCTECLRRTFRRYVPRHRVALVQLAVLLLAQDQLDGGGTTGIPGTHAHWDAAVCHLAIAAFSTRVHGSFALLVPPLQRLPES